MAARVAVEMRKALRRPQLAAAMLAGPRQADKDLSAARGMPRPSTVAAAVAVVLVALGQTDLWGRAAPVAPAFRPRCLVLLLPMAQAATVEKSSGRSCRVWPAHSEPATVAVAGIIPMAGRITRAATVVRAS
jgi:hypothetical protein